MLAEKRFVELEAERMDVDLGIFFVDVENAEYPAERLCNDGGNGHARYLSLIHI